jgi:hypothetical protein
VQCPACQHENREGAAFCGGCGGSLAADCPSCGNANPPGQRFCDGCGHALGAESANSEAASASSHSPPSSLSGRPASAAALPAAFASGRYRVGRFLGEGAKKRVHLARDSRLDRDVAIAFVKSDGLDMLRVRE